MIGALAVGVSVARKARQVKQAVGEVKDVLDALDNLTRTYEKVMADGKVTPDEAEELVRKVGQIVNESLEARAILAKTFR